MTYIYAQTDKETPQDCNVAVVLISSFASFTHVDKLYEKGQIQSVEKNLSSILIFEVRKYFHRDCAASQKGTICDHSIGN
jgi:hypothetical protein